MNRFEILTDSTADLPQTMVDELGVTVMPMRFSIQGQERLDWPDHRELDPHGFYDLLRAGAQGTTSALNSNDYAEALTPLLEEGRDVLILVFSSGLSTTYQSCRMAVEELGEKYPERKIYAIDTLCASLGQGLLVWHAAQLRAQGKGIDEVRDWTEAHKLQLCHWFTVDDLNHLKRGGRVSAATALLGTMLSIKPILHVDNEGHLISVGKARGRPASMKAVVDKMAELAIDPGEQTVFISHSDCEEDARKLAGLVRARLSPKDIRMGTIGPVIGCHSGPGTLAVFFLGRER